MEENSARALSAPSELKKLHLVSNEHFTHIGFMQVALRL
jgi:hypothetical protein